MPIQSRGSFFPVEMLAKANHMMCLLAEEPVTWTRPALPESDAISFSQDAWLIFREPEFGPRPTLNLAAEPSTASKTAPAEP
jgi:hypothetical protein